MISSLTNIVLDLVFVIQFHMGVAGVAWATLIAQGMCAVCSLLVLIRRLKRMPCEPGRQGEKIPLFHLLAVKRIARIGLPAGLQGAIFSISNVLIQSSVNSFGSVAMAGNTAAANIEGFVYNSMNAVYQTAMSFTSQNYGAHNWKRITRILVYCQCFVIAVGIGLGGGAVLAGTHLLRIYSSDAEVIQYGMNRLWMVCAPYFLCGMMDVMVGGLRGIGYSVMPMLVSLTGACAFRVLWIFTVFAENRTLRTLYVSYPVSWALTCSVHLLCYVLIRRHLARKRAAGQGA